jgi:hypothetical protein
MLLRRHEGGAGRRRGIILLVVLAMLTLFAILGISFVIYAQSAANEARLGREGEQNSAPEVDPELAFALFMGQFIYDVPDPDGTAATNWASSSWGAYSYLRGHSLARTMYGYNDAAGALNDKPYCGPGRLNEVNTAFPAPFNPANVTNTSYLVNFCPFGTDPVRDPEHLGTRTNVSTTRSGAYVACNVPYTYPDQQNMFLAAMKADGTLLTPSYHRPWLWGAGLTNQTNANWTNAVGKYLTLRPRPADVGANFPFPDEDVGDVKNLGGFPGGNDSIWVDIDAPVMTSPDGRKFKIMVAPLILDLDNRVNLLTAGNILATTSGATDHASNQGWGPWEVNPKKVLGVGGSGAEWVNMFKGIGSPTPRVAGKYGFDLMPNGAAVIPGNWPPGYAQVDYNAIVDGGGGGVSSYFLLPGNVGTNTYQCFPNFPAISYNNGLQSGVNNEITNHPLRYNPMRVVPVNPSGPNPPSTGDDRVLHPYHMAAVLRYRSTNSFTQTTDLYRLLPINLGNYRQSTPGDFRVRYMVTTRSMDLDRPGVLPYAWLDGTNTAGNYTLAAGALFPTGGLLNFPPTSSRAGGITSNEFDPASWKSTLGQLLKIDLNRKLANFPFATDTQIATTRRFNYTDAPTLAQIQQAFADRQAFALDIFNRLLIVTGAKDSQDAGAYRWLAQLAVNIVDYIDTDDIMTPFTYTTPGGTTETVYGTEVPRLLINEVFVQYDNNKADLTNPLPATATQPYNVNVWVELFNPMINMPGNSQPAFPQADDGLVVLQNDLGPVYQIVINDITNANPAVTSQLRAPSNLTGNPDTGTNVYTTTLGTSTAGWGATPITAGGAPNADQIVQQSGTNFTEPTVTGTRNVGWYVVGPVTTGANSVFPATDVTPASNPNLSTTFQSAAMTYTIPVTTGTPPVAPALPQPTILLRRLSCPYLPPNDPTSPTFNSSLPVNIYVTIDYTLTSQPPLPVVQSGGATTVNRPVTVDDRRVTDTGAVPAANVPDLPNRNSFGRRQPYAGLTVTVAGSGTNTQLQPCTNAPLNQACNTFYSHNSPDGTLITGTSTSDTFQVPFDWLVHLDRQLVSPMELFTVSGFKPHELTQMFVQPNPNAPMGTSAAQSVMPHQHVARWTDPTTRLARLLETVGTANRSNGVAFGGRVPGRVNINTIFNSSTLAADPDVFRAIADAQTANMFMSTVPPATTTDDAVNTICVALLTSRTPGWNASPPALSAADRPFLGMGVGYGPNTADELPYTAATTRGVDYTLLEAATGTTTSATWTAPRLLEPNSAGSPTTPNAGMNGFSTHPYQRTELLRKIFNNVTTRSNCFAVWLTVGFFEVTDDTVRPVQLGAEIGRSENRQVRHHMFALVDRTQLQVWPTIDPGTGTFTVKSNTNVTITAPQTSTNLPVTLSATSGTNPYTGRAWSIQAGSVLTFEPDTNNEETVVVQSVTAGNAITATFYKQHPDANVSDYRLNGAIPVISRGNPGPWLRYDMRKDTGVVPFWTIID